MILRVRLQSNLKLAGTPDGETFAPWSLNNMQGSN
jgi:hypothetical protein